MLDYIAQYLVPYLWIFWLVLFLVFLAIEALTCEFVILWFAAGAFVTMIVSIFLQNFIIQFALFTILSLVLLYFTRPPVLRKMRKNQIKTNVDALIGQLGIVKKEISPHEKGEVKHKHLVWMASSKYQNIIEVNKEVRIVAIKGATLVVEEIK